MCCDFNFSLFFLDSFSKLDGHQITNRFLFFCGPCPIMYSQHSSLLWLCYICHSSSQSPSVTFQRPLCLISHNSLPTWLCCRHTGLLSGFSCFTHFYGRFLSAWGVLSYQIHGILSHLLTILIQVPLCSYYFLPPYFFS